MQRDFDQPMDISVTQIQSVKKKNLEVRKQLLYNTYSNVINILEEIESRQLQEIGHAQLPRSSTEWFDHSKKSMETLNVVAQAQILVFESMLKTAEEQAKGPFKSELLEKTRTWIGVREKRNLTIDIVDKYAYMLLETLAFGKTSHDPALLSTKTVDCKPTNEGMNNLFRGMYESERKRKPFEDNPSKEAACNEIRSGEIKIIQISCGSELIWGLDNTGKIHTMKLYNPTAWKSMDTQTILFKEVKTDIHDNGVYAVGINGALYWRTGITRDSIRGHDWSIFEPTSHFKVIHVEVCSTYMMFQNVEYEFWYYNKKDLFKLRQSENSGEIEQFSCGGKQFWGIDHLNTFYNGTFDKGWKPITKLSDVTGAQVNTCDDGMQVWINVKGRNGYQVHLYQSDAHSRGRIIGTVPLELNGRSIRQLIRHSEYFIVIDDSCRIWSCCDLSSKHWQPYPELKQNTADEWHLLHLSSNSYSTWAVDNLGNIIVHTDTDGRMIKWQKIPTGLKKVVKFTRVFVSPYYNCVWALDDKNEPYCRLGMSPANVVGRTWKHIESPGRLSIQHLSITPNCVMALDEHRDIWSRKISERDPVGQEWEKQSYLKNDILCDKRLDKIHNKLKGQEEDSIM